ncbi:MAG: transglutaminase-like domain-containing protein [Planctomycetota bacterium]
MSNSSHLRRVTLLLVAIATAQVQFAVHAIRPGSGLWESAIAIPLAIALWAVARRRPARDRDVGLVAAVLALGLFPLVWDPVSRALLGVGLAYEVQLAFVLRNTMLALAATPQLPRATVNATLGSLFLVVFCAMWSIDAWTMTLLVLYSIVGVWWLLAAYWDGLGGRFADSSETAIPIKPAVATVVMLALLIAVAVPLASRSVTTSALAGFLPSSGGTQWSDQFANGGVGDGQQLVGAKEEASSFGPIDCELFLESKMPSLYDAFNEFSDAVPKKPKERRRAIPLAPSQVQTNHKKRGVNQQATREFSAVRQKTKRRDINDDRLSTALLHVVGRTPQHLALETFDQWDGHSLIASTEGEVLGTRLYAADAISKRWLKLAVRRPDEAFPTVEDSQVRVINLKTNRVPTPAGTTAVTMKGLHAANMFKFADDGSLAMDVPSVPTFSVFEFQSAAQARYAPPKLHQATVSDTSATSGQASGKITQLAADWVKNVPAGWAQVEAIVSRLAEHCTHDPEAVVSADADDALEYFLFQSRRGPDYLFATTTAVMLQSLGYDTRVRAGFYVDPKRYNYQARLTPVVLEDAHFWVEVLTSEGARITKEGESLTGVWATIEATPGYQQRYAPETLLGRLSRVASYCVASVVAAPFASVAVAAVLVIAYMRRRPLLDTLIFSWWSIRSRTAEAGRLTLVTLRLLEWRAWLYRECRPAGTPLGRWGALASHQDFASLASWALYGSGATAPLPAAATQDICRRAIKTPFGSSIEGKRSNESKKGSTCTR